MIKNFSTKTRWLVTIILTAFSIGQMWGATRTGWTRVTTVNEIKAGGTFIVGFESSANSNTIVPMINKPAALSGVGSKTNSFLYSGTASSSDNTTIDMSDKGSGTTTNYEFEIVTGSTTGTIAIKLSDNTYVGFHGSSNNNCKRCASVCDSSSFTPTITTNDVVTLTNAKFTGRKLRFNNSSGSYRFSNYSTAGNIVMYKKTASCSADPSIGTASLNGSFNVGGVTSLSNISNVFTCASSGAGSASCSISEYGFVWSSTASTAGTLQKGSSGVTFVAGSSPQGDGGSFTGTLSGTWTVDQTYYYRGYVKNNGNNIKYDPASGVSSFTVRGVSFNSNGGSSVDTKYVKSGSTITAPSAPTKTGYAFDSWRTTAELTTAVNWSSTISASTTYYAKWTANTYSVRFNKNNNDATGTMSNESFTYGESKALTSNAFSLVGYTFAGWATSAGDPVVYTDGQSVSNLSSTNDATVDLYAKWTAKSFDVTWMVNGETYSAGGSTSVDFDSKVAALPTPPTPPCGNKFMGWTTTNIGSVGIDKANTSAITALNLFTTAGSAPTISAEGNVTYYAVFADYAE